MAQRGHPKQSISSTTLHVGHIGYLAPRDSQAMLNGEAGYLGNDFRANGEALNA